MTFTITPLHALFGAKITGLDLTKPITAAIRGAIETTIDTYAVCLLPGQCFNDEQQITFARLYGPLELTPNVGWQSNSVTAKRRIEHREIIDLSNLDADGHICDANSTRSAFLLGNQLWHTDSSFRKEGGAWSMLHARAVPPTGGDTEFADTRAAYEALTEAMRGRLEGLVAEHCLWHSRTKLGGYIPTEDERTELPPAQHALVRRHGGSGRRALYLASHASHVIGMPVEEGRALLADLITFATQPRFVYRHRWQAGDLVIWDNRCTLHRATPYPASGHIRDMRRTTIVRRLHEASAS